MAPPFYFPILLIYSASDVKAFGSGYNAVATMQYLISLEIIAVQLNQFKCGSLALGVCFSHKIIDGSTASSFLNAWAKASRGQGNENLIPKMEEAAMLFPPMKNFEIDLTRGMLGHKNIVTKKIIFSESNIFGLRKNIIYECSNFNISRVEAVTALMWKSSLEAAKASSGDGKFPTSKACHAVNIRNKMTPTLPKHSTGNLWHAGMSSMVEVKGELRLHDLVERVREAIKKIDGEYISKLHGVEFPNKIIAAFEGMKILALEKSIPFYSFTSWINFNFYEANFGWGKPTYVHTIGIPMENWAILMATRDGNGIEALLTLTTHDMTQLEQNPDFLNFASFDS
ncbi:hypothetical protein VNO78_24334 [Psophocarpus tetragonolobus]|uniref:Uncharacterized protein n=1 Tax=Psophocarpus tetragonolobus TaxID=3891 RepID=A0AAN9XF31_PSOTE